MYLAAAWPASPSTSNTFNINSSRAMLSFIGTASLISLALHRSLQKQELHFAVSFTVSVYVAWWLSGRVLDCSLQVAGSIPDWWLSRNIGQLSLASLRGC